jgi:hypothetical protein
VARVGIFRIVLLVLAVVAVSSLISNGAGAAAAGLGFLLLVPFLIFKIFLFVMLLGFIGKVFWRSGHERQQWIGRPWDRSRRQESEASDAAKFEEWHRMAHAKEEVDRWVPEV